MPRAWVGTSGYDYDHWKHAFYPPEMPRKERLAFYARTYDTVELNNTFYNLAKLESVARWSRVTPKEFRFVAKGSQYITHRLRLKEPRQALERFLSPLERLGPKLAGFLWQFPGHWKANPERLRAFVTELQALSRREWWHAFEFRHGSWLHEPTFSILRDADMPLVLTDMPFQVIVPGMVARDIPRPVVTAPLTSERLVYLRRHGPLGDFGGSYPQEMTDADAQDARRWMEEGRDVWAFFNNDPWAHAVGDARRLDEALRPEGAPARASARSSRLDA